MRPSFLYGLLALFASVVFANLVPRGNCGSCMGSGSRTSTPPVRRPGRHPVTHPGARTGTRPRVGTGTRMQPVRNPYQTAEVTGLAPTVDVTQFIEDYREESIRSARQYAHAREQHRHHRTEIITDRTETQQINSERLGNRPFQFVWHISVMEPGMLRIRISPQRFSDLISQWSAVNNHVTVLRYRIRWRLYFWQEDLTLPRREVIPVPLRTQNEPLGSQTIVYQAASPYWSQYEHVPAGTYFQQSVFERHEDETPVLAFLSWRLIVDYVE